MEQGGDRKYLDEAFDEAFRTMRENLGGPFGAVVVKNGQIIGRGANRVTSANDPTAHAEIEAIRDACRNQQTFELAGCTLYSTCEPCPMCLSAIYWARIRRVCYASTRYEAESIGFIDNHIYQELGLENDQRSLNFLKMENPRATALFSEWKNKKDKTGY